MNMKLPSRHAAVMLLSCLALFLSQAQAALSEDSHEENPGFPAVMPLEKPDRPLSAAIERLYDQWHPHEDRGNELYSNFKYSRLSGFDQVDSTSRRDPSKVVKIDGTYYVWYTKRQTRQHPAGPDKATDTIPSADWDLAEIWYATSTNGFDWQEEGVAITRPAKGRYGWRSVATPDILIWQGKYYLYYQGFNAIPFKQGDRAAATVAEADTPRGPWRPLGKVVVDFGAPDEWDGNAIHDPYPLVYRGKIYLYYKGQPFRSSDRESLINRAQGVAIADHPFGPFVKSPQNPVTNSGHETGYFPWKEGIATILSLDGPEKNTLQYAPDGINFEVQSVLVIPPVAPGPFVPDAFADNGDGRGITWGLLHIYARTEDGHRYTKLARFDCDLSLDVDRPEFKRNYLRFDEATHFQGAVALHPPIKQKILAEQKTVDENTIIPGANEKYALDIYGGWAGLQGQKTGYFHLEEINGRHWFVTPEGNVFFPVALSHLYSGESDVACQNVYGGDKENWLTDAFAKAKAMGFNCALGSATSPERNLNGFVDVARAEALFRENNFPYAVGVILLKHPWEFVEGENLPDIFEPAYKQMIEARAAAVCPPAKDDPLVMGYYYGFGAFNHSDYWVNQYLSLPPGSAGRSALVDVLIQRYDDDVRAFNRVYGTSLNQIADLKQTEVLSFDRAFARRNYPKVQKTLDVRQVADFEALLSHMAVTLFKIGHAAIRRWDTNHLIFGSFVKEFALSAESYRAAAPYIDMVAPQHINRDVSVHKLAEAAGLPILISDEYFGWHYPGKTGSLHAGLASHDARAEVYRANLMRHYKDPQVLGVTYCACMYDQGGNTLKKNNQNGFYDIMGNPRVKLIKAVTDINREVYTHTPTPATPEELKALDEKLYETWDKHLVGRTLWGH